MAETKTKISITQPKATTIKKPNDAILDAGCHRLKRFWKANRIVYVKMCGTIIWSKRKGKQTTKQKY